MKVIKLQKENLTIDKTQKELIVLVYDLREEINPKLYIRLEKDVKASIVEVFINGIEDETYEIEREITLLENSSLVYVKYQDASALESLRMNYTYDLKKSSKLEQTNFELGNVNNTNTYETKLENENVLYNISGLVKLDSKVHSSSSFETTHIAQSCTSDIKYKHSLDDWGKATFNALSIVEQTANFSKVFQNTDTILLSDDAGIFAQPHLQINIDELEASHGATTGTLNEEQSLYLQSRGIKKELATEILLKAFENEIFDSISDKKIIDFLKEFKRGNYV